MAAIDAGPARSISPVCLKSSGRFMMGGPQDFPDHGVRCFLLIDPNGVAINVVAPLSAALGGT